MKKLILSSVAALALAGSAATLPAVAAQDAPEGAGMRHMDMGYMLDAKIAGMKAALKLTTEQEKLWPAFETAVRDAAKLRREMMGDMREKMNGDARPRRST